MAGLLSGGSVRFDFPKIAADLIFTRMFSDFFKNFFKSFLEMKKPLV
jgi:hypothetical protein